MIKIVIQAIRATLLIGLLTGIVFPLAVTLISQLCFSELANGSLVKGKDGQITGSSLIAQAFKQPQYFHPRPSSAGSGYAGEASGATNLGPASQKLIESVKQLAESFRRENGLKENDLVPVDAVTRSGSGLDPHISCENAYIQARRVATARHCELSEIKDFIAQATDGRQFGILGEPGVNVLRLNKTMDEHFKVASRR